MALILNTLTCVLGAPVTITSGTLTQPAGTDPALTTAERNLMVDALAADSDGGSVEIGTAGMALILATFPLNTPSFASASGGSAALDVSGLTVNASANGTAAEYRFRTAGAVNRRTGTVSL